jgi:hypothetical protein
LALTLRATTHGELDLVWCKDSARVEERSRVFLALEWSREQFLGEHLQVIMDLPDAPALVRPYMHGVDNGGAVTGDDAPTTRFHAPALAAA